jgi:hypothetical protein
LTLCLLIQAFDRVLLTFVKERHVSQNYARASAHCCVARAFIYPSRYFSCFFIRIAHGRLIQNFTHPLLPLQPMRCSRTLLLRAVSFFTLPLSWEDFPRPNNALVQQREDKAQEKIAGFMSYKKIPTPRLCVWNGVCNNKSVRRQRIMRS